MTAQELKLILKRLLDIERKLHRIERIQRQSAELATWLHSRAKKKAKKGTP